MQQIASLPGPHPSWPRGPWADSARELLLSCPLCGFWQGLDNSVDGIQCLPYVLCIFQIVCRPQEPFVLFSPCPYPTIIQACNLYLLLSCINVAILCLISWWRGLVSCSLTHHDSRHQLFQGTFLAPASLSLLHCTIKFIN